MFVAGDSAILGLAVDVGVPRRVTFNVQPAVISKVVIGASAIYIIDANGRVYHLGGNGQGQGGHGDTVARSVATRVEWFVGQGVAITDVFPAPMTGGSENYVFFVGGNGKAYVAGANANGQHGMGDATARSTPAEVTALGSNVAGVVLSATPDRTRSLGRRPVTFTGLATTARASLATARRRRAMHLSRCR